MNQKEGLILGNRIPKDYFVTTGYGETDKGSGIDPWETGAYDLALKSAQIENFNIVEYTSVLPPEATEQPINKLKHLFQAKVLENPSDWAKRITMTRDNHVARISSKPFSKLCKKRQRPILNHL